MKIYKQGESEEFNCCDWPRDLAQIGSKSSNFWSAWPWNLMDYIERLKGTSSMTLQALYIILWISVYSNWSYSLEILNLGEYL